MNTYDPADRIRYVHLAQAPGPDPAPPQARDECHRLPAGYANASLRARLGGSRAADARPALVLLAGGSAAATTPTPTPTPALAAPALRLAR